MQSWTSAQLRVIGHMERRSADSVPRLLRAVFEVKDRPGTLILPPYRWDNEGRLTGGSLETAQSFAALVAEGDAERLDRPHEAAPGHLLWADEHSVVRYAPAAEVRAYLERVANDHVRRARAAFDAGRYPEAIDLAQVAIAATGRNIAALVIAAKAHQKLGSHAALGLLRSVARSIDPTFDLDVVLDAGPAGAPCAPADAACLSDKYRGLASERPRLRQAA